MKTPSPIIHGEKEVSLHAAIKELRHIGDDIWPDARGEIEIFKMGDPTPLEEIMNPPFSIDFLKGNSLHMLLNLSEREGYWELVDNFLKPMLGKRLRFHYALTREIIHEDPSVSATEQEAPVEKRVVMDLSFSGTLRSWGLRRFSQYNRQSYNILFTGLRDTQTPDFQRPI